MFFDLSSNMPADIGFTPQLFDQIAPGITTAAAQVAVPGEDWITSIMRVLPQLAMADHQRRLLNIQLERAQNNQPPLDMSNFGLGVNVGLSPQTQQLVLIAVVAAVVLFLATRKKG